jgi:hypothetical protein
MTYERLKFRDKLAMYLTLTILVWGLFGLGVMTGQIMAIDVRDESERHLSECIERLDKARSEIDLLSCVAVPAKEGCADD